MSRTTVSEDDLLMWLNARLHENGDLSDCRFESVSRLKDEDKNGCNWYKAGLRCSGIPVTVCDLEAAAIVTEGKKRFNVL